MREYETVFIVQPEISDAGCESILERVDQLLASHGARRLFYDDIGKRKLAYEIRKFQKGHYWCVNYLDEGRVVPELERMFRLDDSILRYLTVQVEDHVGDVEARVKEGEEKERIRRERAAERAAREAEEERARREAEAAARAEAEAARAAEQAAAEAAAEGSSAGESSSEEAPDAAGGEGGGEEEQA